MFCRSIEVLSKYDILPCKAWRPTASVVKITVLADVAQDERKMCGSARK